MNTKNKYLQKYLVNRLIKTGSDENGVAVLEADIVIETKEGLSLYCNADQYFTRHQDTTNIHRYDGRRVIARPMILNFSPILKSKKPDKPSLKVIRGKGYYHFFGKITSIERREQHFEGKIIHSADAILDCGTELVLSLGPKGLKKGFKVGDYVSTEGQIYLFDIEFLEEENIVHSQYD